MWYSAQTVQFALSQLEQDQMTPGIFTPQLLRTFRF